MDTDSKHGIGLHLLLVGMPLGPNLLFLPEGVGGAHGRYIPQVHPAWSRKSHRCHGSPENSGHHKFTQHSSAEICTYEEVSITRSFSTHTL
eukprot:1745919-Amphidinium_carterae.1